MRMRKMAVCRVIFLVLKGIFLLRFYAVIFLRDKVDGLFFVRKNSHKHLETLPIRKGGATPNS